MIAFSHADDGHEGPLSARTILAGFFAVALLAFLVIDAGFLHGAQNRTAGANSRIDADQLVREVIQNELRAQVADQTHWRYRQLEDKKGRKELRDVIDTKDGEIYRVLAVNGQPLTPEQNQTEEARIQKLLAHPNEIRKAEQKRHEDFEKERKLLQSFAGAFSYQYDGVEGDLVGLKFTPNPHFHPSLREEQVFHSMEGTLWIDVRQKRLAGMEGRLTIPVKFGEGLLGHLDKGGTFSVKLEDVGSGHWDLDSLDVQVKGKALLFKTIDLQQIEHYTNYRPIPDSVTLQQAARLLRTESTTSAQR